MLQPQGQPPPLSRGAGQAPGRTHGREGGSTRRKQLVSVARWSGAWKQRDRKARARGIRVVRGREEVSAQHADVCPTRAPTAGVR